MKRDVFAWSAARWGSGLAGTPADIVRLYDDPDGHLAVITNAYDHGFATCWPAGSRLLLDSFVDTWASAEGPLDERLIAAFSLARSRFEAEAPALVEDREWPYLEDPRGALIAMASDGRCAHVAWIGGGQALLVRGGHVVDQTEPHTMQAELRLRLPSADPAFPPGILARTIGRSSRDQEPPTRWRVDVEADDLLVLMDREHERAAGIGAGDVDGLTQLRDRPCVAVATFRMGADPAQHGNGLGEPGRV
ncbi:MAG: PP2C family serine/threonine-protein phosphatase [Myxococcota bacterium]